MAIIAIIENTTARIIRPLLNDNFAALNTELATKPDLALLGAANGIAQLGSDTKLLASQLPNIAVAEFLGSVADEAAMLALVGETSDWCIRTDSGMVYVITGPDPTNIGSWTALSYPTAPVTSVAGRTGTVVLTKADVGLTSVDNTSDTAKPVSIATQAALDLKASVLSLTTHTSDTANPHAVTKAQVGLGNANDTSDAAKPVSIATQAALDLKASTAALAAHLADVANPHAVTKTQVGLGSVDNTADTAKPVSTPTQTALNLKANLSLVGAANGIASLGSDGKVPTAQLPAAGTGDVVGPASATTNAVARFSGTTGKLLQNSGVIIDGSNNVTGIAALTATSLAGAHNGSVGATTPSTGAFTTLAANGAVTVTGGGPGLSAGVNDCNIQITSSSGFPSIGFRRSTDTNGGWLVGSSHAVVGDFGIAQNLGASTAPAVRLGITTTGAVNMPNGTLNIYGFAGSTSQGAIFLNSAATTYIYNPGSNIFIRVTGTDILSIASTGLTVFGSLITGAPSGGSAAAVKFGSYVAGAPAATGYQQLDIGGVAYKVLVST